MKISGTGQTDIGKRRERNEDHLLVDNRIGLYVVADGIGGYAAGDVASHLAIEVVRQYIYEREETIREIQRGACDEGVLSSIAAAAVARASRVVHDTASADRALTGMGCTLTLLLFGHTAAAMAHVGDSRVYLSREGQVSQLSTDHNLAQELVQLGVIEAKDRKDVRCGHALTRSVGREVSVSVQELLIELEHGDQFLLCTDGLSGYFRSDDDITALLDDDPCGASEASAHRAIDFANASGGQDNITAIIVAVDRDATQASHAAAPIPIAIEATGPTTPISMVS